MEQSKYMVLARRLRADITGGRFRAGQKLPTEAELGVAHGLSRQTVRQAIGALEREGLVRRKQGSGTYVLCGSPEKRPTKNIGVVSTYMDAYIFPSIIEGISSVLRENGYLMQLSLTNNQVENEARALEMLLEKDVDGLIVEPTKSGLPNPNTDIYYRVKRTGIPLVFFNAYYPNLDFPHVCMDDRRAGLKAAKCLIDAGHTAIAGVFQSDDRQGHLRYMGFMDALREAGLETKSSNITWFMTEDIPYLAEDIARVERSLNGCTGLVCYNDQIAYTIMSALIKNGHKIPDELSMIGIDDAEIAKFCEVPLTSLAHPMRELGRAAAQGVLALIDDPEYAATREFEPELTARESVKIIKAR